jgi:hypothetical protein
MKQMILPDTSVWITYFRNSQPELVSRLEQYLLADRVAINGIILAELVQGLRNNDEKATLVTLLGGLHVLELPFQQWELAGELSSRLRKSGMTLPLTDVAIAANAMQNNATVMTLDAHFQHIPDLSLVLL